MVETWFTVFVTETHITIESGESHGKELIVSTFAVSCPCGCGEAVEARDAGFSATTVEVVACSKWAANGITTSVVRKSWAFSHAVTTESAWQHVDGLVVFS